MSAVNLHISYELFVTSSRLNYSYRCQPCKEVYNDDEFRVTKAIWWFYFSKLLEFADSFFFVLRKKDRQLTFLHVYHHSTMFPLWWIGVKFVPSGSCKWFSKVFSIHLRKQKILNQLSCRPWLIRSYMFWCIRTMRWPPSDQPLPNFYGGKNIWQSFNW